MSAPKRFTKAELDEHGRQQEKAKYHYYRSIGMCVKCGEESKRFARCVKCRKKNILSYFRRRDALKKIAA